MPYLKIGAEIFIKSGGSGTAMKLLADARSLGEKPSGVGIYAYNFIRGICSAGGWEICLLTDVCVSEEMSALRASGVEILALGRKIKKNIGVFAYFRFVKQAIQEKKPDIFWEVNNFFPVRIKNPYGKIVVTVHDIFPVTMPECYGRKYAVYFRYGMKNMLRYADAVLYDSEDTRNQARQAFRAARGKESFLARVIVNRLPEREIADNGSFLYIGNLEKRKGTDILLEAYRIYRRDGGRKELRIGGKIREREIEELLRRTAKETGSVAYLGYLTEEQKQKEYASCSCFLFPSRAEGFGIPVMEAMSYRKTVLAGNLAIFRELVGDSIRYFALEKDAESSAENLAESMLCMDTAGNLAESGEYDRILERYSEKVLTAGLTGYFEHLVHAANDADCGRDRAKRKRSE